MRFSVAKVIFLPFHETSTFLFPLPRNAFQSLRKICITKKKVIGKNSPNCISKFECSYECYLGKSHECHNLPG